MPVTFFAHQAAVLPVARRWPGRVDGLALVIGSMVPDMAYVLNGSRFRIWAHDVPGLLVFCLPVTLAASWVVARILAPVVADHLPGGGPFHLRDYRGLATHRFRPVAAPLSACAGTASHALLDHLTHGWGWFARNAGWYRAVFADDVLGRSWTVFRVMQYGGHVLGTAACVWLLARYGRQRWMAERARTVPAFPVTASSRLLLAGCTLIGVAAGVAWIAMDSRGSATDTLRVAATTFSGLTVGALLARRMHVTQLAPGPETGFRWPARVDLAPPRPHDR